MSEDELRLGDDSDSKYDSHGREESDNNFADIEDEVGELDDTITQTGQCDLESNSKIDNQEESADFKQRWFCRKCKNGLKSNPNLQLCGNCFKIRRNSLPKRQAYTESVNARSEEAFAPPPPQQPPPKALFEFPSGSTSSSLATSSKSTKSMSTKCNICLARPKNAAFVHLKAAHQYSCFTCADTIYRTGGKCPYCKQKILRIVKVFVV